MDPTGRRTRSQTNSPGRRITRKSNVRAKDSMDALSSASSEAERTFRTRQGRDVQRSDRDVPDVRSTRGNTGKGGRAIRNASVALAEATNTSATPRPNLSNQTITEDERTPRAVRTQNQTFASATNDEEPAPKARNPRLSLVEANIKEPSPATISQITGASAETYIAKIWTKLEVWEARPGRREGRWQTKSDPKKAEEIFRVSGGAAEEEHEKLAWTGFDTNKEIYFGQSRFILPDAIPTSKLPNGQYPVASDPFARSIQLANLSTFCHIITTSFPPRPLAESDDILLPSPESSQIYKEIEAKLYDAHLNFIRLILPVDWTKHKEPIDLLVQLRVQWYLADLRSKLSEGRDVDVSEDWVDKVFRKTLVELAEESRPVEVSQRRGTMVQYPLLRGNETKFEIACRRAGDICFELKDDIKSLEARFPYSEFAVQTLVYVKKIATEGQLTERGLIGPKPEDEFLQLEAARGSDSSEPDDLDAAVDARKKELMKKRHGEALRRADESQLRERSFVGRLTDDEQVSESDEGADEEEEDRADNDEVELGRGDEEEEFDFADSPGKKARESDQEDEDDDASVARQLTQTPASQKPRKVGLIPRDEPSPTHVDEVETDYFVPPDEAELDLIRQMREHTERLGDEVIIPFDLGLADPAAQSANAPFGSPFRSPRQPSPFTRSVSKPTPIPASVARSTQPPLRPHPITSTAQRIPPGPIPGSPLRSPAQEASGPGPSARNAAQQHQTKIKISDGRLERVPVEAQEGKRFKYTDAQMDAEKIEFESQRSTTGSPVKRTADADDTTDVVVSHARARPAGSRVKAKPKQAGPEGAVEAPLEKTNVAKSPRSSKGKSKQVSDRTTTGGATDPSVAEDANMEPVTGQEFEYGGDDGAGYGDDGGEEDGFQNDDPNLDSAERGQDEGPESAQAGYVKPSQSQKSALMRSPRKKTTADRSGPSQSNYAKPSQTQKPSKSQIQDQRTEGSGQKRGSKRQRSEMEEAGGFVDDDEEEDETVVVERRRRAAKKQIIWRDTESEEEEEEDEAQSGEERGKRGEGGDGDGDESDEGRQQEKRRGKRRKRVTQGQVRKKSASQRDGLGDANYEPDYDPNDDVQSDEDIGEDNPIPGFEDHFPDEGLELPDPHARAQFRQRKKVSRNLYYQDRNRPGGRVPWTQQEVKTLLESYHKHHKKSRPFVAVYEDHGPKGKKDTVLELRTLPTLRDKIRNLVTSRPDLQAAYPWLKTVNQRSEVVPVAGP